MQRHISNHGPREKKGISTISTREMNRAFSRSQMSLTTHTPNLIRQTTNKEGSRPSMEQGAARTKESPLPEPTH